MKTTILEKDNCPYCGKEVDSLSDPMNYNSRDPKKGDLTICVYCYELSALDENFRLEKSTEADLNKLPIETKLQVRKMREAAFSVRNPGLKSNLKKI